MRVLVAARDVRVRQALSRLLELNGGRVVGATDAPRLLLELGDQLRPDLVVLEMDRSAESHDLQVVEELARSGHAVIAVCSGSTTCAAVLRAGARASLDKDAEFPDRLGEAIRAVAGPWMSAPPA